MSTPKYIMFLKQAGKISRCVVYKNKNDNKHNGRRKHMKGWKLYELYKVELYKYEANQKICSFSSINRTVTANRILVC